MQLFDEYVNPVRKRAPYLFSNENGIPNFKHVMAAIAPVVAPSPAPLAPVIQQADQALVQQVASLQQAQQAQGQAAAAALQAAEAAKVTMLTSRSWLTVLTLSPRLLSFKTSTSTSIWGTAN